MLPAEPAPSEPPAPGREAWPPSIAWLGLIGAIVAAFAGGLVISVIGAGFGAELEDPPPAVTVLATLWQDVALIGAAVLLSLSAAGSAAPRAFGYVGAPFFRSVALGFGTWVGFLLFAGLWTQLLGIEEQDRVTQELGVDESTFAFVVVAILVTVIAPLVEETFFRGFFYGALRNWRGVWPAALLTGIVFGAVHLGSSPLGFVVPLAIFGALLCLLYERTGSLLPCIAVHALNNAVAFGVSEDWTWQIALLAPAAIGVSLLIARTVARR